jgi:hypothetical protein
MQLMVDHDAGYKRLFSHREMVADLLTGFVDQAWADLRRAFVVWLRQVLLPRRMPQVEFPEVENLQEVRTLLAERVKEWSERWRAEGRAEGQREGEAQLLLRLLTRKFGPLDPATCRKIAEADAELLLTWGERLLNADRLEGVFADQ